MLLAVPTKILVAIFVVLLIVGLVAAVLFLVVRAKVVADADTKYAPSDSHSDDK